MSIVIAGAGIGGLTAALSLHAAGRSDVLVLEAVREIREVGVGINLPPHAVRELSELGLGDALDGIGVRTKELAYYDPAGQLIWAEPRGLDAGYRWPQYSVHRGRLQRLLVEVVQKRLGMAAVQVGHRVKAIKQSADVVEIEVVDVTTGSASSHTAEALIVADGIRSTLRDSLIGEVTPLASNGWVMYRGTATAGPFLSGESMVIIGDESQRIVVYPIGAGLLNWLLVRPKDEDNGVGELGNWNAPIAPEVAASFVRDFRFDWLDVHALIASSSEAYQYPMADIDPLPRWVFGRCVLLGDAAHAMYPFGSNGASQAILDARVLAYQLANEITVDDGLMAYEALRRPVATDVQLANRRQAGDVMARVSAMARRGAHGDAAAELQDIERRYKQLAGFDVGALNERRSWSVVQDS
ncbi:FAD-dependent monooxygenase [Tardiphaga sp.]|uniref:FAD-dependent monooxygenase n=1 Tax=Tardiphaga sp. TaxID=1926292 RepID=UPI0025CC9084|nr:FAD-dependent monooxygenase [Tardiphaga sp.]